MRISRRTLTAAAITAAAIVLTSTNAGALATGDEADLVAQSIEAVRPNLGPTAEPTVSAAGDLVAEVSPEVTTVIPEDAEGVVSIDKDGRSPLAISLPAQIDVADADVAADGTVVYTSADSEGVSVAVQALEGGSVSIQTVLDSAASPTSFTYTLQDDVVAELRADGGADLVADTEIGRLVVGQVLAPWAVDADGSSLATRYEVQGNTLTQVVTVDATTSFPVVADPTFGHSWGIPTMYLSKKETREASNDITPVYIACAASGIFGPWWIPVCEGNAWLIQSEARRAAAKSQCVKVLFGPGAVVVRSFSDNCR